MTRDGAQSCVFNIAGTGILVLVRYSAAPPFAGCQNFNDSQRRITQLF